MLRSIPRKVLIAGLILVVLGLAYFVSTQNESVNSGPAAVSPTAAASPEPITEPQASPEPSTSSNTATTEPPKQKVDTAPLNELDASLDDNFEDEVDSTL